MLSKTTLEERVNRLFWDDLAELHQCLMAEERQRVIAGCCTLRNVELKALGSLQGERLLHLMCHRGHDSVSLARLGAKVSAIDHSQVAISAASELARECRVEIDFRVESILKFDAHFQPLFNVVYMGYGVLEWVPNLRLWAQCCANVLTSDGRLIVIDDHPLLTSKIYPDIVPAGSAVCVKSQGSYLDRKAIVSTPVHYRWSHSVEQLTDALLEAGFEIDLLQEHSFSHYRRIEDLYLGADGYFHSRTRIDPLLIEVRASKRLVRGS